MKDTLDLQKFYPEEIGIKEVTQNEKEIYIHVSVHSKNCTSPKCGVVSAGYMPYIAFCIGLILGMTHSYRDNSSAVILSEFMV